MIDETSQEPVKAVKQLTTNAVTRSLDDLHLPTWFGMQAITISVRTAVMHPLSMAASRKRVSDSNSVTIASILRDAYRESPTKSGVLRQRSIRNIYRGFGIAVIGNILGETSCLWVVEAVKQSLLTAEGEDPHSGKRTSLHAPAIAGACGDLVAIALTTPLSIVCDRQLTAGYGIAQHNRYQSVWNTASTIWRGSSAASSSNTLSGGGGREAISLRAGLRNVYAGAPASLAMLPAAGVWWSSYVEAKFRLYTFLGPWMAERTARQQSAGNEHHSGPLALVDQNWFISSTDNPLINGLAGIVASVLTAVIFTPLAVVRTRLQTLPEEALSSHGAGSGSGRWRIVRIATHLYQKEGLRGFYRGGFVNIGMALLDGLAFSTLYEFNKLGSDRGLG